MTSIQLAWLIRRHGIEMTHLSGGSHIASVMSVADIIAVLYADILEYDPARPEWDGRDRFIMSKGHAGAAVYAALAESGFFDVVSFARIMPTAAAFRGTFRIIFPVLTFQRARSDTDFPLPPVWRSPPCRTASRTAFLPFSATVSATRVRSGRQRCLQIITGLKILSR